MEKISQTHQTISTRRGLLALSPVPVFLFIYVVVSIAVGDFYSMPIVVALAASAVWSVAIMRHTPLSGRIEVFSKAAGHSNILYMVWVFVLAGAYATLASKIGAVDATVNFTLNCVPPDFIVPALFVAACFISFSIGTSVGTVVALTPLAVELAHSGSGDVAFFVAVVLGGAFFGDNLSFISDTTIAATRSQEVNMRDKFKANIRLVLPAALVTLVLYTFVHRTGTAGIQPPDNGDILLLIPYVVIIATALMGINVMIVLILGIIATLILGVVYHYPLLDLMGYMGNGIDSMGNLIIITLLSAGMLGIIKAAGGITFLLDWMTRRIKGSTGAKGCITALVALVNLCTANNTVAIITVGPVARDICDRFGVDRRKCASLLDTGSCIVQCLIPYGAQTLMACTFAGISPVAPLPYLFYPMLLSLMVVASIFSKKI